MNQATNVNIVPSYGQRGDLHFSQYDVGRTATINLYAVNEAYTIPVGATVKIQATKPSGLGFDVACTFSGSVVTVVSTETMTAEAGRFPAELHIIDNSDVIGTANFMFVVEASPHPDGVIDGDAEEVVNEIKALVLESEGYALGTQDGVPVDNTSTYWHNNAKYFSENVELSDEIKQALLGCFQNVAWINGNGQTYYDALVNALNPGIVLVSISAVYTQGGTVYDTDSLDSLKSDLVVTAHYDDSSTETILDYTLSGTLVHGTSTITVSYGGKTTTFNVTVSEHWSYSISDFTRLNGALATDQSADCGVIWGSTTAHRYAYVMTYGVTDVAKSANGTIQTQHSGYYPIKVPEGATSVTVSITPNTQYVGVSARSLTSGVYTILGTLAGYIQGSTTITFEGGAQDNYWLFVSTKYNSAGTSYPTAPTGLDVVFSS